MKRKPNVYDRSQHQLICNALGVSDDYKALGDSAYEAVCVLLLKIDMALQCKTIKDAKRVLKKKSEDFSIIPMYGVD